MAANRNIHTICILVTCLVFSFLLCTDPAKPDFNEEAKLTDKQIKVNGNPVLDSLFFLYVSAEGTAPLFYQWFKDNVAISNAKDDTLTFDALSPLDSGAYKCLVWNDYGADTSLTYILNILIPPAITTPGKIIQTSSSTPKIDSSFFMYIKSNGSDTLKYKWFKGTSLLQNSTYDSLKFAALDSTDTGSYQCIVANNWGSDTSAVYNLSVSGNNPPVWVRDTMTDVSGVGTIFKMSLPDSCTDPDGDSITFTLVAGPPVGDTVTPDKFYNFTPTINDTGLHTIILQASDGKATSSGVLKLFITDANLPPEWVRNTMVDTTGVGSTFKISLPDSCIDPEGDTIAFTLTAGLPDGDSISIDNFYTFTPTIDDTGEYSIGLSASDGTNSSTAVLKLFVTHVNLAPEWVRDTMVGTTKESATFQIALTDSCIDPNGDNITFTLETGAPANDSLIGTNIYRYTPSFNDAGLYFIKFWAKDAADSSTAVLRLTVIDSNRAPEFKDSLPMDLYRIQEGQQLLIKFEAEDPDGDTAIVFHDSAKTTLPRKETIVFNDSQLVWQSNNSDSGAFSVVLGATDNVDTNYITVTVTVNDVNLPPEISITGYQNGDNVQIKESIELAFTVTVNDPDPGQTPVLLSPANIPAGATYDTASGNFSYTPAFTVSNKQTNTTFSNVTFYATDNVTRLSDTFAIHITVLDSNRAPQCTDTSLTVNEETTTPVNIFAADADGDAMTWTITKMPDAGTVDNTTGSISTTALEFNYTADNLISNNFDTIQVRIEDGVTQCVMSVFITINGDNDKPVITQAPPVSVVEDNTTAYPINIAGYDPESTAVKWYIHKIPKKGNLDKLEGDISAGIEMLYTLKADSCGKDTLSFYLLDAHTISSDTQAIIVTIDSLNDAPVIQSQTTTPSCDEDNDLTLQLSYLNVTDVDNAAGDLSLVVLDGANYSVVSGTTIRPDQDYDESLTIKVQVSDGKDSSIVFDMSATVNPINDKPEITNLSCPSSVAYGSAVNIQTSFVDVDGNISSITYIIDSQVDFTGAPGTSPHAHTWTAAFGPYVIGPHNVTVIIADTDNEKDTSQAVVTVTGTLISDTLSVRSILDLSGNTGISASDVIIDIGTNNRVEKIEFGQYGVEIDTLAPDLSNLSGLKILSLFYNWQYPITIIPEIGNLSNLTDLDCQGSIINNFPPEIGQLTNLTKLYFGDGNNIASVPQEIGNLVNLQYFELHGILTSLPSEIENLTNLTYLNISYNNLTDLPSGIIHLTNIGAGDLDLAQNRLFTANPTWKAWADARDSDWFTTQQDPK